MVTKERWVGDNIGKKINRVEFEKGKDTKGWRRVVDFPVPINRLVWVITEYQRRCIVQGGIFVKWAILDEKAILWHVDDIVDFCIPPEFPEGWEE